MIEISQKIKFFDPTGKQNFILLKYFCLYIDNLLEDGRRQNKRRHTS